MEDGGWVKYIDVALSMVGNGDVDAVVMIMVKMEGRRTLLWKDIRASALLTSTSSPAITTLKLMRDQKSKVFCMKLSIINHI